MIKYVNIKARCLKESPKGDNYKETLSTIFFSGNINKCFSLCPPCIRK